ncbi:MAG: AAA family ATPase [Bacteroidota bacterium]
MFIQSINIKKFRHLENISIGPLREDSDVSSIFVLAGPNGCGKSSILELIGYALSNSYSLGWALTRTFTGFSFEIGIGITDSERDLVLDKINSELAPIEAATAVVIGEIENRTDLTSADKEMHIRRFKDVPQGRHAQLIEMKKYLSDNKVYYRAFALQDSEYAKNSNLHNQIHAYVSAELKGASKRSLGFFLRADRNYPQKGFDRNKIFNFDAVSKREHLWTIAFNTSEIQYQDMYEYLVQQRYHFLRELGQYHNAISKGDTSGSAPIDPLLPYEQLLNKVFPNYEFVNKNETIPTNLFVKIPNGEIITFNDLSSGE